MDKSNGGQKGLNLGITHVSKQLHFRMNTFCCYGKTYPLLPITPEDQKDWVTIDFLTLGNPTANKLFLSTGVPIAGKLRSSN